MQITTLETVSGKLIDIQNPNPKDIVIEDIAWALSRIPRFAGHSIPAIPLSVAEHSLHVAQELQNVQLDVLSELGGPTNINDGNALMEMYGLLHDAAEAFIGDIPSPVKKLPGFYEHIKHVENKLLGKIFESLEIPPPTDEINKHIKQADLVRRAVESYQYMFSRGADWGLPKISLKKLQSFRTPLTSLDAYDAFLEKYYSLRSDIFVEL